MTPVLLCTMRDWTASNFETVMMASWSSSYSHWSLSWSFFLVLWSNTSTVKVFHVRTLPQYLSFVRMYLIPLEFHSEPVFVFSPVSLRCLAIDSRVKPERYASYMYLTMDAWLSTGISLAPRTYLPVASLPLCIHIVRG